MKNILPSGKFYFEADDGEIIGIDPGTEFEMTQSELENNMECDAFFEGHIVFADHYDQYDDVSNCMSDVDITNYLNKPYEQYRKMVDTITSEFTFDRIEKLVLSLKKPSEYYQYVTLRKMNIAQEKLNQLKYMTDAEKNKRGIID